MRAGTGQAHAKVILLGEHSVVHGSPAIALPVSDLTVEVTCQIATGDGSIDSALYQGSWDAAPERLGPTLAAARSVLTHHGAPDTRLDLQVRSTIPVERGLGSSAAVAAATVQAVLHLLGKDTTDSASRHELIQVAERVAHGTPSGLDARTVVSDQPLWFQRGDTAPLQVGAPLSFVIADTGNPSATRIAVAGVHAQHAADAARVDQVFAALDAAVHASRTALAAGSAEELGALMSDAHALLQQLEVSSADLDHLVQVAHDTGALGAKLTGGGRGGCIIALAQDASGAADLAAVLREHGAAAAWPMTLARTS